MVAKKGFGESDRESVLSTKAWVSAEVKRGARRVAAERAKRSFGFRNRKYLILGSWFDAGAFGDIPTPTYIVNNKAHLDRGTFDGMTVYARNVADTIRPSTRLMRTPEITYTDMMTVFAPLVGVTFKNLERNFALIQVSSTTVPPDWYDDWSVLVQNWANYARACRDMGFRGFMFDPERYVGPSPWIDYSAECAHFGEHTYDEYSAQAQLRGKQCMEAALSFFPDIEIIQLHGPYISESQAATPLGFNPGVVSVNDLMGPFFSGLVQAAGGTRATICDGGELYQLRTLPEFVESRRWRRETFPSNTINCSYLPATVRRDWGSRVTQGFGVYQNGSGTNNGITDPQVVRTAVSNALKATDRYVWFYPEGQDFNRPAATGGASEVWHDAIQRGKEQGNRLL